MSPLAADRIVWGLMGRMEALFSTSEYPTMGSSVHHDRHYSHDLQTEKQSGDKSFKHQVASTLMIFLCVLQVASALKMVEEWGAWGSFFK
jgi:hypothetical protein